MSIRRAATACLMALVASTSVSYAGPCTQEITKVRGEIDARLDALAKTAPTTSQSTAATTHRQPTPKSISDTETELGIASPQKVKAIREAMARALEADRNDDPSGCEKALADARRLVNQ